MPTRMQFPSGQLLQRIRHVDERAAGPRLDKGPLLALGILHHDAPMVREQQRQRTAVGMGGVAPIGALALRRRRDDGEGTIAGLIGAMASLEPILALELQPVRQARQHRLVGLVAERGETFQKLSVLFESGREH